MKTWNAKPGEIKENWYVVDATDKPVGRLASEVAKVLRGKNKPTFTPHVDTGDFVIILNSKKVQFSGTKWESQKYYSKSRFFGSLKETAATEMLEKDANHIITHAVKGMLPHNKLSNKIIKKLKVYEGGEHPHSAQRPEALNI